MSTQQEPLNNEPKGPSLLINPTTHKFKTRLYIE